MLKKFECQMMFKDGKVEVLGEDPHDIWPEVDKVVIKVYLKNGNKVDYDNISEAIFTYEDEYESTEKGE